MYRLLTKPDANDKQFCNTENKIYIQIKNLKKQNNIMFKLAKKTSSHHEQKKIKKSLGESSLRPPAKRGKRLRERDPW